MGTHLELAFGRHEVGAAGLGGAVLRDLGSRLMGHPLAVLLAEALGAVHGLQQARDVVGHRRSGRRVQGAHALRRRAPAGLAAASACADGSAR